MQVMAEKAMTSSVAEVFPCSSGTEHQKKEIQETAVGIIETPAPPQVSCFQLQSIQYVTVFLILHQIFHLHTLYVALAKKYI